MKKLLTESLTLALVPALAHILAYLHEYGYCQYFGVPSEFISISFSSIFSISLLIIGFSFTYLLVFDVCRMTFSKNISVVNLFFAKLTPLTIIGIANIIKPPFSWFYVITCFVSAVALILLEFSPSPKREVDEGKSYSEKLNSKFKDRNMDGSVLGWVANYEGGIPFLAGAIALTVLYFSFTLGISDAARQKTFLKFSDSSNTIVLRNYGDNLICGRYDPKTKRLTGEILFKKLEDTGSTPIIYKKIGPLESVEEAE